MSEPGAMDTQVFAAAQAGADALSNAIDEFVEFVKAVPENQWNALVRVEERTVGVMAFHIANGLRLNRDWLEPARRGEPVPGDDLDKYNAGEAVEHAGTTRDEVLEMIARNRGPAIEALGTLTAAEWEITVPFGPGGGIELPVSRLATAGERHIRVHLGHVREALAGS